MVSLITTAFPAHFPLSHKPFSHLNPSPHFVSLGFLLRRKQVKKSRFLFEFSDYYSSGVVTMCKREVGEGEGEDALELELLEFMKNSKNPEMFPSKSELIQSGRVDLAEAIENGGGWMSMGWDHDDDDDDDQDPEGVSFRGSSSPAASSSGQSIEMPTADDSGIEGILSRLERHRSLSFGLNVEENGSMPKDVENSRHAERYDDASLRRQMSDRINRSYSNISSSSIRADSWQTWSTQRAGVSNTEFEAAEMDFGGNTERRTADTSAHEVMVVTTDIKELLDKTKVLSSSVKEINQSDVKTRLRHLEVELSSVLRSLRSNTSGFSEKAKEHMSEDLRQLSDATEFQENETMKAQEKLRSIRAKLAVLEGKMALAITDAKKVLDDKQTRIDNAHMALQLLRTTCIVWANSGSEVLLVGSFDGWATQRKMEKSSSGIFTLSLKLYPGQYEIKFIVDGSWKVDPLRPLVNHGGFENNLLIVT